MKSTFSIAIKVLKGNTAISNNKLVSEDGDIFVFEKTPVMSTYIVTWAVGKLDYI